MQSGRTIRIGLEEQAGTVVYTTVSSSLSDEWAPDLAPVSPYKGRLGSAAD
jgi:hypothetical protein